MPRTLIGKHRVLSLTGHLAVLSLLFCLLGQNGLAQSETPIFAGWNYNTRQSAAALNDLQAVWGADNPTIFAPLINNPRQSVDQFRGTELVASSAAMALWRPWDITHQRVRTLRDEKGWHSWGEGYYRIGEVGADNRTGARRHTTSRPGTMFGADYGNSKHWQFGAAFGYAFPTIDNSLGKICGDDITVGLYSKYNFFDQGTLSTFLGYGYQHYKLRRNGFGNALHQGSYNGDAGYASIEYVRMLRVEDIIALMPLIAIDHQTAWTKKFTETPHSNQWSQSVSGSNMSRTMFRFGIDSKWDIFLMGTFDVASRLQCAILLDGDRRSRVEATVPLGGASMNLRGADMGWFEVNAGLTASGEYGHRFNWFVDLDTFTTGCILAIQGQIGLSTRW